ncbi:MAG TPA: hypothetical protein VMX17_00905 [Candidatus Glassbacteria bacterium]|nr:hypothetical protein [Candidatus Glassbacteria bacterium]
MVLLTLVDGKKGPNDILVLVTSYNEPLTFAEWLYIGKCYLDSEASYYPIKEGYIGQAMLIHAINELALGVDFQKVLKRYKLQRKGKSLKVIDKRKPVGNNIEWKTKRISETSYSSI